MNAHSLLKAGARRLERAGRPHAQHEVEWLLGHMLSLESPELYLHDERIPSKVIHQFWRKLEARLAGAPLQYLLEETAFYGATFSVSPGVFIPRPETEQVVEAALEALQELEGRLRRPLRLLDVGTGSGCIAITLARHLPTCVVVGLELSWSALAVARNNVLRQGLNSRVRLIQGRGLEAIQGRVDGVISNPPYIPSAQVDRLPLDVRQEPRLSLDGGADGLDTLRALLAEAPRALHPGGLIALECGEQQVSELLQIVSGMAWVERATPVHDLADRPRGVLVWSLT